MRTSQIVWLIIILLFVVIGVTVFLVLFLTHRENKKYEQFVIQYSISLNRLKALNSRYSFNPFVNCDQFHTYDNETFYNMISCTDFLIYQLQFIAGKVFEQIKKLEYNRRKFQQYTTELSLITQFGEYSMPIGKLKLNKLLEKETALYKNQILKPSIHFALTVTLKCATMSGNVYARKRETFTAEEINKLFRRLNNRRGTFYNDREIWDALCRVERGKVSNKMRFSIYERDDYRCRYCGISGRYNKSVQLEIDHIIPIAKGGKSTDDNLQTLCRKCNKEKGDRW